MKYLKKYEARSVNEDSIKALQSFLEDYNKNKKRYDEHPTYKAKQIYKIPEIFHEEFCLLSQLYEYLKYSRWSSRQKSELNYVKKEIKKRALESIKRKFEENPESYKALKNVFDKRPKWNDSGSFDGISDAIVKNIFFLFENAVNNPPGFISGMHKYNL